MLKKRNAAFLELLRHQKRQHHDEHRTSGIRRKIFSSYHGLVQRRLRPVISYFSSLEEKRIRKIPWNIQLHLNHLRQMGKEYLSDVGYFIRKHTVKPGKVLSFHVGEVVSIPKKKAGKPHEFGLVFQLGRIGGSFLIAFTSTSIRMEDKPSLLPVIKEHLKIFDARALKEVGIDKGYYSDKNVREINTRFINSDGIQRPVSVKTQPPSEIVEVLRDRRAGIEPLIGHAKAYGLRKSKMKSDCATLASG